MLPAPEFVLYRMPLSKHPVRDFIVFFISVLIVHCCENSATTKTRASTCYIIRTNICEVINISEINNYLFIQKQNYVLALFAYKDFTVVNA